MPKKRLITIEDLEKFQYISEPQISPQGNLVAFTITRAIEDNKNGDYESNLWLWSQDEVRQLTFRKGRNTGAAWSPDGRNLAFISRRKEGDKQAVEILTLPLEGGEAKPLLRLDPEKGRPVRLRDLQWSPDGRRIYFLMDQREGRSDEKSDIKVVKRLVYKLNAEGFFHDRRLHLHYIDSKSGRAVQLTRGEFDVAGYTVSPRGDKIAFISNLSEDADYTVIRDIYIITPVKAAKTKQVTKSKGPIFHVAWSPDGTTIAYRGHDARRKIATQPGIWTLSSGGGQVKHITEKFDRPTTNEILGDSRFATPDPGPTWSPDSQFIYFLATDWGSCNIYKVNANNSKVEPITVGEKSVEGFSISKDGTIAYTALDSTHLAELFMLNKQGTRRATDFNDKLLQQLQLGKPQHFSFKASDGTNVDGWILKPPNHRNGKAPAILEIHGGPYAAYGNIFFHEFQMYAANGYIVIYTNPRGSMGYGQDFAAEIEENYGDRDYKDILEALDYVLKLGFVDEHHIGVTGGSYGGFMTNWIVSHTNRFKAAITQRSISNWASFYGVSDIGHRFGQDEVGGFPWENYTKYIEKSPISYVKNVQTPILICHPENDLRCPLEQGEQFYVALRSLKKEAVLLLLPEENHEISRSGKPKHRTERLHHFLNWFNQHLKPAKQTRKLSPQH